MSRQVALSDLRARVRYAADIGPDTTSGRYATARIDTEINQSWQRCRELATMEGDGLIYLKQTTPTTMTAGALNSSSSFGTVPLPADCVSVHGIDVVFAATDIESLQQASWGDRNTFRDQYGGATGRPVGFCVINIGTESTTSVTAGSIAIFPAPDKAYTYTIWYVPKWTDLTTDTHVFDGVAGWDDWVVHDVVIKLAEGDNDMQNAYQIAVGEREKAERFITRRVNKIQRVGPGRRRDVAGMERRARSLLWRRPS